MAKQTRKIDKQAKDKEEVLTGEIVLQREAPVQRVMNVKDIVQPTFNPAQLRIVTNETPKWAIKTRQGRGGKTFKYVPHGYVTDTLNKAFGFDWDLYIDPIEGKKMFSLEIEEIKGKDGKIEKVDRHVVVAGRLVVRVHGKNGDRTITKSGFGSQLWLPTMELGDALKAARSDLIKTCAFQLGIALDLYWNERAELDDFVKIEVRKSEAQALSEKMKADPETPVLLLSRSATEFDYDGMKVAEICGTTIDLLMAAKPQQVKKYWGIIKSYAKDEENG